MNTNRLPGSIAFFAGLKYFMLLVILPASLLAHAQASSWAWANCGDNTQASAATAVAEDAIGNIYTVGTYTGALTLGDSTFTVQGAQNKNIYLAKYSPAGKLLWSRSAGGTGVTDASAIVADPDGDVYIAGTFTNTLRFVNNVFTSTGAKDVFVAKYTKDGSISWAGTYGSVADDGIASGIGIDNNHNLVIGGYFGDYGSFSGNGPAQITFGNYTLPRQRSIGNFIAKFNSAGQVIWAKNPGCQSSESFLNLKVDKQGNIFTLGNFESQLLVDTVLISGISSGFINNNPFLAKYNSTGDLLWVRLIGGNGGSSGGGYGGGISADLEGNLLTLDVEDNPVVGGHFSNCEVVFNTLFSAYTLRTGDTWLAKYSTVGDIIWTSSTEGATLYDMACDAEGSLYLTGVHASDQGGTVVYVAKYQNDGHLLWLRNDIYGTGSAGYNLSVRGPDEITVAGSFSGMGIRFGRSMLCTNNGTTGNGFVAKLSPNKTGLAQLAPGSFSIAPNPASGYLYIETKTPGAYNAYTLTNTLGQTVANGDLGAKGSRVITLPDLPNGMYYLTLSGHDGQAAQRISIQH